MQMNVLLQSEGAAKVGVNQQSHHHTNEKPRQHKPKVFGYTQTADSPKVGSQQKRKETLNGQGKERD